MKQKSVRINCYFKCEAVVQYVALESHKIGHQKCFGHLHTIPRCYISAM
jgi:hypothetical protein